VKVGTEKCQPYALASATHMPHAVNITAEDFEAIGRVVQPGEVRVVHTRLVSDGLHGSSTGVLTCKNNVLKKCQPEVSDGYEYMDHTN
jgi:hypothetical protein